MGACLDSEEKVQPAPADKKIVAKNAEKNNKVAEDDAARTKASQIGKKDIEPPIS